MRYWRAAAAAMLLAGCAGPSPEGPQLVVGALRHGLDPFLRAHPLGPRQEIRVDLVERAPGASVHLVQVRGAERPHRHERHDLVVAVVRGSGVLTLGDRRIALHAGDAALVARGVPHWFQADAGAVAVALVTFAPPLDAPDSVPVLADVDSGGGRR